MILDQSNKQIKIFYSILKAKQIAFEYILNSINWFSKLRAKTQALILLENPSLFAVSPHSLPCPPITHKAVRHFL